MYFHSITLNSATPASWKHTLSPAFTKHILYSTNLHTSAAHWRAFHVTHSLAQKADNVHLKLLLLQLWGSRRWSCANEAIDWLCNANAWNTLCFTETTQLPIQIHPHHSRNTVMEECDRLCLHGQFALFCVFVFPLGHTVSPTQIKIWTMALCCRAVLCLRLTEWMNWLKLLRPSELSCIDFPQSVFFLLTMEKHSEIRNTTESNRKLW